MRRPSTAIVPAIALVSAVGCSAPSPPAAKPGPPAAVAPTKTEGLGAIERLESRVAAARASLPAPDADTSKLTRADQLRVSAIRRAIVAANVALQEAREAVSEGDEARAKGLADQGLARFTEVLNAKPPGGAATPERARD